MTIGTLNMHWLDIVMGFFFLCVWFSYSGSLVDDLAAWLKHHLNSFKDQ